MSTVLVSAFYDYGDAIYKSSQPSTHKGHFLQDRKGPVTSNQRRNSSNPPSPKSSSPIHNSGQQTVPSPSVSIRVAGSSSSGGDAHRKLDRSLSEPAERRAAQSNSSRYKTELCRPFEENGTCKYGDKCQFAHGAHELRTLARHPKYKTELCRTFHSTGFCPYGPRCHFIHNSEESRKSLLSSLVGIQAPPSPPLTRPKALSIGSFSLGSAGDLSPPSSLSGSPTSLNSFFDDPFFTPTPQTPNLNANTAFSFSQDFATLMSPVKQPGAHLHTFGGSQPALTPYGLNGLTIANSDFYETNIYRDGIVPSTYGCSPPSPVDSGSELDCLSLGGSPVPVSSPLPAPGPSTSCSPPLDSSSALARLPIFSLFANQGDSD